MSTSDGWLDGWMDTHGQTRHPAEAPLCPQEGFLSLPSVPLSLGHVSCVPPRAGPRGPGWTVNRIALPSAPWSWWYAVRPARQQ